MMEIDTSLSCKQLEERLAALHQASLELVQESSLDSLLQRIIDIARQQVGATYGAIGVKGDVNQSERFITVGDNGDHGDNAQSMEKSSLGASLIQVIADADAPVRLDYVQKAPRSSGSPAGQPSLISLLGVPIRLGGRQLGQIYLTDKIDQDSFTKDDERVIETLAAYAAVAISNARSYNELRERDRTLTRRNQDLALLNTLASTLATMKDLDDLLQTALSQVINYFNIEAGEIFLTEEDRNMLFKVVQAGEVQHTLWTKDRFSHKESLVGQTARSAQPIMVGLPYGEDPFLRSADLIEAGIVQIACFPLTSRSEVLGVMGIAANEKHLLDAMDQQLLSSIASWVGTTIENIRLNIQGRRLAVLEERERIGMDLHDGVIQSIYAVGLTLEHARLLLTEEPEQVKSRINQSIEDLNSTIRDLRSFIMDMRPRHLYEEDLMDGLQRLINEFRANSLLEATLGGTSEGLDGLPDAFAIALFHICQEALANVAKHAQAKKVEVLVWTTPGRVLMEINDDGRGFDPKSVQMTLGHGISNMQTRARNMGGDIEITSVPDQGTTIMVWMPYIQDVDQGSTE